ncbi:unnamed protein product [Closterium sp. Yama58-4]|nr:unnamed protein product [Closterium sp. Yama58-4]
MRFEIACYKNKVVSWRTRVEKDLDEVLQSQTVFSNVGKGTLAKSKDLVAAFGTDDQEKVCLEILEKGEYQVSDKEREMQASALLRDITCLVTERTVNPETHRPYPVGIVEKFIRDIHFSVDPNRSSKQQALDLIRQLSKRFPITRARMELRLVLPSAALPSVQAELQQMGALMRSQAQPVDSAQNAPAQVSMVCQIEPGRFREVDSLMQRVRGRLEVRAAAVQQEGDLSFDSLDESEATVAGTAMTAHGRGAAAAAGAAEDRGTQAGRDQVQSGVEAGGRGGGRAGGGGGAAGGDADLLVDADTRALGGVAVADGVTGGGGAAGGSSAGGRATGRQQRCSTCGDGATLDDTKFCPSYTSSSLPFPSLSLDSSPFPSLPNPIPSLPVLKLPLGYFPSRASPSPASTVTSPSRRLHFPLPSPSLPTLVVAFTPYSRRLHSPLPSPSLSPPSLFPFPSPRSSLPPPVSFTPPSHHPAHSPVALSSQAHPVSPAPSLPPGSLFLSPLLTLFPLSPPIPHPLFPHSPPPAFPPLPPVLSPTPPRPRPTLPRPFPPHNPPFPRATPLFPSR